MENLVHSAFHLTLWLHFFEFIKKIDNESTGINQQIQNSGDLEIVDYEEFYQKLPETKEGTQPVNKYNSHENLIDLWKFNDSDGKFITFMKNFFVEANLEPKAVLASEGKLDQILVSKGFKEEYGNFLEKEFCLNLLDIDKLKSFQAFCQTKLVSEAFNFYVEVEFYWKLITDPNVKKIEAKKIYDNFLGPNAKTGIDIDGHELKKIEENLEKCPEDIFFAAIVDVSGQLKEKYDEKNLTQANEDKTSSEIHKGTQKKQKKKNPFLKIFMKKSKKEEEDID
jgi:hypothetical protein